MIYSIFFFKIQKFQHPPQLHIENNIYKNNDYGGLFVLKNKFSTIKIISSDTCEDTKNNLISF